MAPTSYQGPTEGADDARRTYSQSPESGLRATGSGTTVAAILAEKGGAVFTIGPVATVAEALARLNDHKIGALLVKGGDGALIGILSERDIVRDMATAGVTTLDKFVGDLMTAKPVTCTADDRLIDMLRRMTDGRFRHLPVVEGEKLVGMISIGDVVKHRLAELEYEALRMKQMIVG